MIFKELNIYLVHFKYYKWSEKELTFQKLISKLTKSRATINIKCTELIKDKKKWMNQWQLKQLKSVKTDEIGQYIYICDFDNIIFKLVIIFSHF